MEIIRDIKEYLRGRKKLIYAVFRYPTVLKPEDWERYYAVLKPYKFWARVSVVVNLYPLLLQVYIFRMIMKDPNVFINAVLKLRVNGQLGTLMFILIVPQYLIAAAPEAYFYRRDPRL